ncbi:hypothetical protein TCON_2396 [Astathelohania contejeani]|uniref:Uncharacterized protein n=1 Tax=Astathelohania contejeani TaxID=164912 RepID=A0ABQ7HW43_9MICR|nr:hypothetical protein TCON_2396 [Thelohania contejeani]
MKKRIIDAIKPHKEIEKKSKASHIKGEIELISTENSYIIKPIEPGNFSNIDFGFLYNGIVTKNHKLIFTFQLYEETKLSDIANTIGMVNTSNLSAFFIYHSDIFLDSQNTKFATILHDWEKEKDINDWDMVIRKLNLLPGSKFFYFDGEKAFDIKINKILAVKKKKFEFFVKNKKIRMCRICKIRVSKYKMIDDPFLEDKDKYLCNECFVILFQDINGNLKYKYLKYELL